MKQEYIITAIIIICLIIAISGILLLENTKHKTESNNKSENKDSDQQHKKLYYTIVRTFKRTINRNPSEKNTKEYESAIESEILDDEKKESFRNIDTPFSFILPFKGLKERFTTKTDILATSEYKFWHQVLDQNIISISDFKKIMMNSSERQTVFIDEIKRIYSKETGGISPMDMTELSPIITKYLKTYKFNVTSYIDSLSFNIDKLKSLIQINGMRNAWKEVMGNEISTNSLRTAYSNYYLSNLVLSPYDALNTSPDYLEQRLRNEIFNRDGITIINDPIPRNQISTKIPVSIDTVIKKARTIEPYISNSGKHFYISYLRRYPTIEEIKALSVVSISSEGELNLEAINNYFNSLVEFKNLQNIVQSEIREYYLNYNFAPITEKAIAGINDAVFIKKTIIREQIPELIRSDYTDPDRETNLRKTIRETYMEKIGREPDNKLLNYWIKEIESTSDIFTSDMIDVLYNGAVYLSSSYIGFFRKNSYDYVSRKTMKITKTKPFSDLVGNKNQAMFGNGILTCVANPKNYKHIWFIRTDGTVDTINLDVSLTSKDRVRKIKISDSTYLAKLFEKSNLSEKNLAGIVRHYLPERRNSEILVFMKDGTYFPWNILTNSSRFSANVTKSTTFGKMEIDMNDVVDVFHVKDGVIGFLMNTNDIQLWDTETKNEYTIT